MLEVATPFSAHNLGLDGLKISDSSRRVVLEELTSQLNELNGHYAKYTPEGSNITFGADLQGQPMACLSHKSGTKLQILLHGASVVGLSFSNHVGAPVDVMGLSTDSQRLGTEQLEFDYTQPTIGGSTLRTPVLSHAPSTTEPLTEDFVLAPAAATWDVASAAVHSNGTVELMLYVNATSLPRGLAKDYGFFLQRRFVLTDKFTSEVRAIGSSGTPALEFLPEVVDLIRAPNIAGRKVIGFQGVEYLDATNGKDTQTEAPLELAEGMTRRFCQGVRSLQIRDAFSTAHGIDPHLRIDFGKPFPETKVDIRTTPNEQEELFGSTPDRELVSLVYRPQARPQIPQNSDVLAHSYTLSLEAT